MCAVTTRQPRWVYDAGDEPDPRFSLANERTFLAWVRTALAMFAGGVALHALAVPADGFLSGLMVLVLVGIGALVCLLALVRWARVERAMPMRLKTILPTRMTLRRAAHKRIFLPPEASRRA